MRTGSVQIEISTPPSANTNNPVIDNIINISLCYCHGGLRHRLRRFRNLVELSYKLKKIYMLCENFTYTGRDRVPGLAGLVSR